MKRREELKSIFEKLDAEVQALTRDMVEQVVFMEERLTELKKLPFIEVSKKDPHRQRATVASKQYKELLQQYNSSVKILLTTLNKNGVEEDSPLREFLKGLKDD